MLPRLRAEESITAANRVALGSGTMRKGDAAELQHRWAREARGSESQVKQPATPSSIWGPLGFGEGTAIVLVPKKAKTE